jgi:putative copper resistance protein D
VNETLTIVVRFALYASLTLPFGTALFSLYAQRVSERGGPADDPIRLASLAGGLAGLAFSGLGLWLLTASMSGAKLTAVDLSSFEIVLFHMSLGAAWLVRVGCLILMTFAPIALAPRPTALRVAIVIAATGALSTLAWTGHASMDRGVLGLLHRVSDIAHILAAATWIGALVMFVATLRRVERGGDAKSRAVFLRSLEEFAWTGSVAVDVILVTGLVNTTLLVSWDLRAMFSSFYGQLLLAKVALFGAMLGLATLNRFHLSPRLRRAWRKPATDTLKALSYSLSVETGCAFGVLGLVAWLGTLSPGT